jgi:hypothetical protein
MKGFNTLLPIYQEERIAKMRRRLFQIHQQSLSHLLQNCDVEACNFRVVPNSFLQQALQGLVALGN